MNAGTATRRPRPRSAAIRVSTDEAILALTTPDGVVTSDRIPAGRSRTDFLATIVRRVGARDRIYIAGPEALRTELERLYVAVHRRPDALVDIDALAETTPAGLRARLLAVA
jgi:hypothetical protein